MFKQKLNDKGRAFAFILYPNDLPIGTLWLDYLLSLQLKMVVSPLHNKDKWSSLDIEKHKKYCDENNIKVDDPKKEHYHIMLIYPNTTTLKHMYDIVQRLDLGINYIEIVSSVNGMYDYFIHKGYQDKHYYDDKDRKCFNGFDINDYFELSSKETFLYKLWLIDFIRDYNIYTFDQFINNLIYYELHDELAIVMSNTQFYVSYLKSRTQRKNNHDKSLSDLSEKELSKYYKHSKEV